MLRDRPARAAEAFARLRDEQPQSPLAAEALYRLGTALSFLDEPAEAILALQQVRNHYPRSRFARRALERITLIHRLRLAPRGGGGERDPASGEAAMAAERAPGLEPPYRVDADYGGPGAGRNEDSGGIRDATDIDIDPQGLAVVASPKARGVFRLDRGGRVRERVPHPDPDFVAAPEGLDVYISGGEQIAVNTRNWSGAKLPGLDRRPLKDFGPIAVDRTGRVHLIDRRENALLIFDRSRQLIGSIRPTNAKEGRFVDVASGAGNGIFVLDGRTGTVVEIRHGVETARIDLSGLALKEPIALAVDALGDLFLLDRQDGGVTIVDPTGRRITTIRPSDDARSRLGRPAALAVDALGRVYLVGRKSGAVMRFH